MYKRWARGVTLKNFWLRARFSPAHREVKRKYFIKAYRHSGTTFRRIHKTKSISSTGFLILNGAEQRREGKNETEIITRAKARITTRTGEIPLLIPNLSGCGCCHFFFHSGYVHESSRIFSRVRKGKCLLGKTRAITMFDNDYCLRHWAIKVTSRRGKHFSDAFSVHWKIPSRAMMLLIMSPLQIISLDSFWHNPDAFSLNSEVKRANVMN